MSGRARGPRVPRPAERRPRTLGLAALIASTLSAAILSACSSSSDIPPGTSTGPSVNGSAVNVPLTASLATPGGSWAVVAMGHLDDPANTFWQLVSLPEGSSRWELATPPGVASNGGIAVSIRPPGTVTAAFGPSIDLLFSPLAQRSIGTNTWSPGVLPGAMAVVPDALAASGDDRYLALLHAGGGTVVASRGDLSTWSKVTSMGSLAATPAASECGITSLTAVAFDTTGGTGLVGAACAHPSRTGIFESADGSWQQVGPVLTPRSSGPTRVLRLLGTPTGVAALASSGTGDSHTLHALFSSGGLGAWTVSAPLRLGRAVLTSTGVTAAGGFIVTTATPTSGGGEVRSASTVGPAGGRWQPLANPPIGTSAVVPGPNGTFEALIADQSTLDVDVLEAGGWRRVQSLSVPVQYGSSS